MGVGVYSDDFNGTGGTFIIDGPLEGDRDDYDDFNLRIIQTVEQAGRDIGMDVQRRSRFQAERAGFDKDFVGILSGPYHDVGWRSWETDFVIGVGATKRNDWQDKINDPEAWTMDVLFDTGRSPKSFAKLTAEFSADLETYILRSMQAEELECRFRTSGYTTGKYDVPSDINEQIEKLKTSLVAQLAELQKDPREAFKSQDSEERKELIRAVNDSTTPHDRAIYERSFSVEVPIYSHVSNSVLWIDPFKNEFVAASPAKDASTGVDLGAIMRDEPSEDGISAIPRDDRTEAWFAHRTQRGSPVNREKMVLVATAQEFASAVNEDLTIRINKEMVSDLGTVKGETGPSESERSDLVKGPDAPDDDDETVEITLARRKRLTNRPG